MTNTVQNTFIHFRYSLNKNFLPAFSVLNNVPDTGESMVNKTRIIPAFVEQMDCGKTGNKLEIKEIM